MPWSPLWPAIADALTAGIIRLMIPGTRVPPMIQRYGPLAPTLPHSAFWKVGTKWDPDGLPAAYPFGHRYLTKEQETRKCAVTETDKKVSTWVYEQSLRACQFSGTTSSHFRHQHDGGTKESSQAPPDVWTCRSMRTHKSESRSAR